MNFAKIFIACFLTVTLLAYAYLAWSIIEGTGPMRDVSPWLLLPPVLFFGLRWQAIRDIFR